MSETWALFKSFIGSPASVGSITPSSRFLVSAMISSVEWSKMQVIAELGAGTGVITDAINHSRTQESKFYCFERNARMRTKLGQRYSDIHFREDALLLKETLKENNHKGLDCVISGLPFANFNTDIKNQLLNDIHDSLRPGGIFLAFQYSRQLKPYLIALYGDFESRLVWANIPPAFVYMCKKQTN